MTPIQPGDGANFTKETSEGTMTGQKQKNVSPKRKPPPRNKREPDRIVAVD
jgi:hypothetical protein